jgi:hypothetical protein
MYDRFGVSMTIGNQMMIRHEKKPIGDGRRLSSYGPLYARQ